MRRYILIIALFAIIPVTYAEYSDHRNRSVDSLENVLATNRHLTDEDKIGIYQNLMWGYLQTDGKKSVDCASQVVSLAHKHNYLNAEADALRIIGLTYYGRNEYDTALVYFNESLEITERMRNDKRYSESDIDDNLSALYGSIGNLYNMQDQLHLAIIYYQKALPIFEKNNWKESTAILYHNVAELYADMNNSEEALRNYHRSLEWAEKTNDSCIIALPHKGLATFYVGFCEYDSALSYLPYAMKYYSDNKDEENEAYIECLAAQGTIYLERDKNYQSAFSAANKALSRITEDTGAESKAAVYDLLCSLSITKQQWNSALKYALMSVEADDDETYSDIGTLVTIAQIYTESGDTEKAKYYIRKVYDQMSKFATLHYQSGISEMEVLYETQKKEMQINQLETERKWLVIVAVMSGLLFIGVLLLFLSLWRSAGLRRRNAVVQAKLEGEIAERIRISRDLHDRLGGLLTAIKLSLPDDSPAQPLTDEAIHEMRNVSHHLLPDSLRRYGLKTALTDYCATLNKVSFEYRGNDKRIQHEDAVYCIVYELVNNAVKNADAKHINVILNAGDESLTIDINDDGKGFDLSAESDGKGLNNVRDRVNAIGGTIDINSAIGSGTQIHIVIR